MGKDEYNDFVNNGKVSDSRLLSIAKKVCVKEDLHEFEYAVFCSCVDKINKILIKNKNTSIELWVY
jgi:hypothetical protein